jgi:hypothetical protein
LRRAEKVDETQVIVSHDTVLGGATVLSSTSHSGTGTQSNPDEDLDYDS